MFRKKAAAGMAAALCIAASFQSFAGTWMQGAYQDNPEAWIYIDSSSIQNEGWKWIDGNKDGIFESYYFKDGIMQQNTNIDGYDINNDGNWTYNGEVQRRSLPSWISVTNNRSPYLTGYREYPEIRLSDAEAQAEADAVITKHSNTTGNGTADETEYTTDDLTYDFILSPDDRYLGLTLQNYVYSGGAHGLSPEYYYTITPEKGILELSDIAKEGGESELLSDIRNSVRRTLRSMVDSGELYTFEEPENIEINLRSGTGTEYGGNWLLAPDGLHVVFGQYEIAPYSAGNVDVTVPYSDIAGSLNEYGREILGIK